MPKFISAPAIVMAAGNKPKQIQEFIGGVNTGQEDISIARMISPAGWQEPPQQPEFAEISIVLRGLLRVEAGDEVFDVRAGQAILTQPGERVRYSTPEEDGRSTLLSVSRRSPQRPYIESKSEQVAHAQTICEASQIMFTWMINRQLDSLERRLGESVDYLRHVARTSTEAFLKFLGFVPLAAHRGNTPRNLLFAARFVATKQEDCGTCVQIVVNQAIEERVNPEIVAAMIAGDEASLDAETRLAAEFARAVLDDSPEQERLRSEVRTAFGERAMVDISLAIATARVFPTLKRGLGYAVSCRKIAVQVRPNPERRSA